MILQDLKNRQLKGDNISFEISNHKRIPSAVKIKNVLIGHASISTIKAFKKWKEEHVPDSESFYCKYFTEDEFATSDEKCKNQCEFCKGVTNNKF